MKKLILGQIVGMMMVGVSAMAALTPGKNVPAIHVNSAHFEVIGSGFPQVKVTATATFSNSCHVPQNEELLLVSGYRNGYGTLLLTLANLSERVCPAVYQPVTVTMELGTFTRPNDGLFKEILVNGVVAVRQ